MAKLWTSSRKFRGGIRRYTWWSGRQKLCVAFCDDHTGYINDLSYPIKDDQGKLWYRLIAHKGEAAFLDGSKDPLQWMADIERAFA